MITVLDSLLKWCEIQPTKNVWVFLNDKNEIVDSYTYQVNYILTLFFVHLILKTIDIYNLIYKYTISNIRS